MGAGDRYTAKKILEARGKFRDPTRFDQQNDAISAGWKQNAIMTEGVNSTLREAYFRALANRKTWLEQPDDLSGPSSNPICSTKLPPLRDR
jgi:hypothetical protein